MGRIDCPVYGFYGGKDARVTSTVTDATEQMKKAGKIYDPVTYEDAGHGFMRDGEDPTSKLPTHAANIKARDESWKRWKELLGKI
jgi:carboxymethylenebutenolidase